MSSKPAYTTWANNTNPTWYKDSRLRRSMLSIFVLYFCAFTFGYDGSLLAGLQTMPKWKEYFHNPSGNRLGLISASFYLPKIPIGFLAAYLSEKFGRRVPLLIGSVLCVIGAVINGLAHNEGMFMGGRALVGAALAMQATVAPPLIGEIAHPRLRSVAGGSYLCVYYVGSTVAAWFCFGLLNNPSNWGWRAPVMFQMFGSAVVGVYTICGLMPESPRWLVSKGQTDKAHRMLAKLHANGKLDDELVLNTMAEIETGIAQDRESKNSSYLAFFKTPGNRRRVAIIIVAAAATQLVGNGLVSYYLAPILTLLGVTKPVQQASYNVGLAIFNLVVATAGAQFVDRWGRRKLWLTGAAGMLVCFAIVTGLSGSFASHKNEQVGTATIAFLFLFYGFYDISLTVLPNLYVPEIVPFHLRSKAMAIYIFVQSISITLNQWVNPIALKAIAWKYYIVYLGVQVAFLAFCYFYFLETKGRTIEEVSVIFDGPQKAEQLRDAAMEDAAHGVLGTVPETGSPSAEKELKMDEYAMEKVAGKV